MSTILKALRRLEEEGAAELQRPLRDQVVAAAPGEPLARRRRGPAAVAFGLGAITLVGFFAWRELPSAQPAATAEPERAKTHPASQPPAPSALTLTAPPPAQTQPVMQVAALTAPAPSAPDPAAEAAVAVVPERRAPARSTRPAPPAVSSEPRRPPAAVRVARHPAPALVVTQTIWHPDPARRRAVVEVDGLAEPLKLREGDAVGSLIVSNIAPSGVVFLRGEVELRRRVGATR